MEKLFAGIDLGTSGCRLIIIDTDKNIKFRVTLAYSNTDKQSPELWWHSVSQLLQNLPSEIKKNLQSIAVDGTSGTVLLVGDNGEPLSSALMYNDLRATDQATRIKHVLPSNNGGQGASGSLAKVLWLLENELQNQEKQGGCALKKVHIQHQADFILGKLSHNFTLSDENNCLKLGYDVVKKCWPLEALNKLGIDEALLPKVFPAGTAVDKINHKQAKLLGLPANLQLVTGTTDSIAAFIATGADNIGDAVTSLGSTLVLKLISNIPIFSPKHGIYSHRLNKKWLVGGASNSGAKVLQHYFSQSQIDDMTKFLTPEALTHLNYYPLIATGERFPIADAKKKAVLTPRPESDQLFFQGILEGIAKIEAQGFQKLMELGAPNITTIRSVGGGSKNTAWTKIRKNCLDKKHLKIDMITPLQTDAAYGVALLALNGLMK